MALDKKDFIEIEFTGRIKGGEIFDSNIKEDLKKLNPEGTPKPFIFCIGQGMFLKGVEDFLLGKEIKEYEINLSPEEAFGKRDSKLIQMIPMKIFREQKVNPIPGIMFNFDGKIAKILSVSGGRVLADFNGPIAGKEVTYKLKVLRKVEDINEKIKAFIDFLFRQDLKFEVKDQKITIEAEIRMVKFVEMFAEKFKEVFNLELVVKPLEEKKETSKTESDSPNIPQ